MNNENKDYVNIEIDELLLNYGSTLQGLSNDQVKINKKKYGQNVIEETKSSSVARVFLEQFQDILVIILIASAIISIFTGGLESTIVIFSVITLNAILGTVQYFKAEKSLQSLKKITSPIAKVLRDNTEKVISSADVVVGDIIILAFGDVVAADCRIINCNHFEVNESSLTGEGLPVEKDNNIISGQVGLGEAKNMAFSGTQVIKGKAVAVVVSVGIETELGKIAKLMKEAKSNKTPLEDALDEFSKKLAILIIAICVGLFFLNIYRNIGFMDSLMFAVALAVAAIPEALCAIVTIVLALGTQKMASQNAIVKDLKAVEGLGCVNVICTDKTGTLTENKMKLSSVYCCNKYVMLDDLSLIASPVFLTGLALCNDADYNLLSDSSISTDSAIAIFLKQHNVDIMAIFNKYPRLDEYSFDSKRKKMSTLHSINNQIILYTKGAAEVIVASSKKHFINNQVFDITDLTRSKFLDEINKTAAKGQRVIGLGYKVINHSYITENDEKDLIFLGFVGLIDPPKPETAKAIADTKRAGIKPVVITGDHRLTAEAIAYKIGIHKQGDLVITGLELDNMSDDELLAKLPSISVFARVSPENKIRIVEAWQKQNATVAFIGDGINDAPAIKKANVGVSMGKSGTEVSKDASSIILMDDNYQTIVTAVKKGRNIYNNIQNAILFLLSGNAAGIITVVYTCLLALPIPFAPVHLLFINLLTDSLPAIGIGMEEDDDDVLNYKPSRFRQSILHKRLILKIMTSGILLAVFTIISYYVGLIRSIYVARTCAFATLCIGRLFHSYNCLGGISIIKRSNLKKKNITLTLSFIVGLILINIALFIPSVSKILSIEKLSIIEVLAMYSCSIAPTIIIQILLIIKDIIKNRK